MSNCKVVALSRDESYSLVKGFPNFNKNPLEVLILYIIGFLGNLNSVNADWTQKYAFNDSGD